MRDAVTRERDDRPIHPPIVQREYRTPQFSSIEELERSIELNRKKLGRPPLGARAMTRAELVRRQAEKKRREKLLDQPKLTPIGDLPQAVRILALSDIHNDVSGIRQLRVQEKNRFDAMVVAGDIGRYKAAEIFEVLKTFNCPILYVCGNWDGNLSKRKFGRNCHLIHRNIIKAGILTFTGFSFPNGRFPDASFAVECRQLVKSKLAKGKIDPRNTIFMSHAKATHLTKEFPNLLLHIYGHIHTFDDVERAGTRYINVSAVSRHSGAGNYAIIEITRTRKIRVECRLLRQ